MQVNAGTVAAVLSLDVSPFSEGINATKAMLRTFKSDAASASQKIDALGKMATGWGKSLTYTVTAAAMAAAAASTKTYASFEDAMLQVKAVSGATQDEYAALAEAAKEAGASTRFTARESANAFNYMAMAGWKTNDMLDGLGGILDLAAASGADLATTSDIVTDALTAMGYAASDAGRLADVMAAASANANTNVNLMGYTFKYAASIAGTLGYSMEDLAVATGLMGNAGIKGEMAGTQLRAGMLRLIDPTDEAAAVMKKYNLSIQNSDGSMKSLMDVMGMYRTQLGKLDDAEKAQAATRLFGMEAATGWLSIINASQEDVDKLTTAVYGAEGAAASMAQTMESGVAGSARELGSAWEGLLITIGEDTVPVAQGAIDWLTGLVRKLDEVDEGTRGIIMATTAAAAAAGPALIVIGKAISALSSPLGIAVAGVTALAAGIATLNKIAYDNSLQGAMDRLRNSLDEDIAGDVAAGLNVDLSGAESALDGAGASLAQKARAIYDQIQKALTDGKEDTPEVVQALVDSVTTYYETAQASVDNWEAEQIAKLNTTDADYATKVAEIKVKAQECRDTLTAAETDTVNFVQTMAGKSAEYVQQHADELDAMMQNANAAMEELGIHIDTLMSRGETAYRTAKTGVSKDAETYGLAANWAETNYKTGLSEVEAQGAADMAALQQAYAQGAISKQEYESQEWSLQQGQEWAKNRLMNQYRTYMREIFQGAIKAYDGTGAAGELAGTYAQMWMRDEVQAALDGFEKTGELDLEGVQVFLRNWLTGALKDVNMSPEDLEGQLSGMDAVKVDVLLRGYINQLEAQIKEGMDRQSGSGGLSIIQAILDGGAGETLGLDTSSMETTIRAAYGDVGQEAKAGLVESMEDKDGTVSGAGIGMADAAIDATKSELEINSPSRVYFGIGQNMMQGLINGVASKQGELNARMRAMARAAIAAAKQELGVHSPSTVFRDIGRYVGKGFTLGIDDEQLRAEEAVRLLTSAKGATSTTNNYGAPSYNISVQGATVRSEEEARELLRAALKHTTARQRGYGQR